MPHSKGDWLNVHDVQYPIGGCVVYSRKRDKQVLSIRTSVVPLVAVVRRETHTRILTYRKLLLLIVRHLGGSDSTTPSAV